MGPRRRRRDVRHRLPGAVADGRLGRGHQGPRARHAGLLEHRRPGLDGLLRRPGHQAVGVRQGAPRPARAAQGARPDPRWPTATSTSPRRRRPTSTTSTGPIMEANAYPGPAVVIAYTPCQPEHGIADDAAHRQAKLAVDSRAFPLFTYDPRRGERDRRAAVAPGQPGPARRLGEGARRDADRLPRLRPDRGPVRRRTSRTTARRPPRSSRRSATGSRTGARSRSSPGSADRNRGAPR